MGARIGNRIGVGRFLLSATLRWTCRLQLLLERQSRAYGTSTVNGITNSLVSNPELAAVMRAVGTHS